MNTVRTIVLLTVLTLGLVFIGNAIAWPASYFMMQKWLQNLAYKMGIGMWIFALSAGISLAIAFLTIGYQSFKSALANPADSLRYE